MDDFRLPDFVKDTGISLGMINMWIGGTGRFADETKTMLHMDTEDNVYALVEGTKAFTLYAPAYAQLMYPRGAIRKVSPNGVPAGANNMIENMHHQHFTAVDHPHEPDRSRFSEFPARAAGLFASCTVHACAEWYSATASPVRRQPSATYTSAATPRCSVQNES